MTVACDVTTRVPRRGARLRPAEGRDRRAGRAAHPPARAARRRRTSSAPASTCATLAGAGAAGGLAGGLAAIGAELEPGFDVVADAAGLDDALDGVDLVVTGEGKLDATSFDGKVVGGVLEWAADAGVAARRGDRGSGDRRGARGDRRCSPTCQVLALTDRVWQAGEAFSRAAVLVEEAAVEAGRAVARRALIGAGQAGAWSDSVLPSGSANHAMRVAARAQSRRRGRPVMPSKRRNATPRATRSSTGVELDAGRTVAEPFGRSDAVVRASRPDRRGSTVTEHA